MQRFAALAMCAVMSLISVGCSSTTATQSSSPATPAPTEVILIATPTLLPPATVTPFPTITPRPVEALDPSAQPTGDSTDATPSESGTAAAQPSPTRASGTQATTSIEAELDRELFSTDFSQGWPSIQEDTVKIALSEGRYVFEVGPFDGRFIYAPAINVSDYYAQVEAAPERCPEGGGYGLLFRFVDADNYYLMNLLCNNTYTVIARVNGALAQRPLSSGSLPAGLDGASDTTHVLGVLVRGDHFTLYLDGQMLATIEDSRHSNGSVTLYAVTQMANVMRVAFDNLEVWAVR